MTSAPFHPHVVSRIVLRWLISCATALALLAPVTGWAQQCNSGGFSITFDTVSSSNSSSVSAQLPYNCQANANNTYYNVCLFIPEGNIAETSGINPRYMTDYNNHKIPYNLYSDPARTQIVGPPPSGGGYPIYTWSFMVPGGWSSPARNAPVYGFVPIVPNGTVAGNYQAQMGNITLQYSWSNNATPIDCQTSADGGRGAVVVGYGGTHVTVSNSCRISLGSVADLDFGSVTSITTGAHNASTTISITCPGSTSWKMGLDNGVNASGNQRRMKSSTGGANFVNYELYRDSARTQRWGNNIASGSDTVNGSGAAQANPRVITVYGSVPAQTQAPAGSYSDMVIVTLEY